MLEENTLWVVGLGSCVASLVGLLALWFGRVAPFGSTVQRPIANTDAAATIIEQPSEQWYEQYGWLALALIVIWPVGYFGLLKTSRVSTLAKGMATTAIGLLVVYSVLHREIQNLGTQINALQSHAEASSSTAQKAASDAKEVNRKFDEIFRKSMRE